MTSWRGLAALGRAESTLGTYRTLAGVHLIPQLGKTRLSDLTADQVEEWLHGRATKLAPATVRTVHQLLKRAIRRAQRHATAGGTVPLQEVRRAPGPALGEPI